MLRQYLDTLQVTVNSWALAGCFDCMYNEVNQKYAHWQHCMEYCWDIEDHSMKALDNHNEDSILDYISTCEALVRTK
eukprot:11037506-Karenia_brevis.AAC.1